MPKSTRTQLATTTGGARRTCARQARHARHPAGTAAEPRDVEALERVIDALDARRVRSELDAHQRDPAARSSRPSAWPTAPSWLPARRRLRAARRDRGRARADHGGRLERAAPCWSRAPATAARRCATATGPADGRRRAGTLPALGGRARRPGAPHGCFLPVVEGGRVIAVLEYYSRSELPFFGGRHGEVGGDRPDRRARAARPPSRRRTCGRPSTTGTRSPPSSPRSARRPTRRPPCASRWRRSAPRSAGPTARSGRSTRPTNVLRFDVESGSAGEEFRKVTLSAPASPRASACPAGPGGRATWSSSATSAEVTDCVRAPAAQRAGVRSGVCFPIVGRRPGRRHDGLLHHRDHRAVRVPRLRAAQRAAAGLASGWTSLRRAARPTPRTPAPCWRPSPGCARPPTTPAGWPRARSARPRR